MDLLISDYLILSGAAFLGGVVRGFTGFGTALVFLPVAGRVLDPVGAVAVLLVMDLIGPLPMMPKALPHVHWGDLRRLILGMVIALPLGLTALFFMEAELFRVIVGVVSLTMLVGLATGWRYSGKMSGRAVLGTGMASGFLGGVAGIPGPPVIFFYMASSHAAQVIRANVTSFLIAYDWILIAMLAMTGRLSWGLIGAGAVVLLPYLAGNMTGSALFDPTREKLFRGIAYIVIAGSAIGGLPFWG